MKRWNLELVKIFIAENSNCELITEEYKNTTTEMEFKCSCGNHFKTMWKLFVSPKMKKRQCNDCGRKNANKDRTYSLDYIKDLAKEYNLVVLNTEYKNCKENLSLVCECGNDFQLTFDALKNGSRKHCFTCQPKNNTRFQKGRKEINDWEKDFYEKLSNLHGEDYEVLSEYECRKSKIKLKHKCGYVWETTADHVLNHKNQCPSCFTIRDSKLVRRIRYFLIRNNLEFKEEVRFKDCKLKRTLPFDFAVFQNGKLVLLIEADGSQHFNKTNFHRTEDDFRLTQFKDAIKNNYCIRKNIPLLRIPYYDLESVNDILIKHMPIPSQASENE